MSGDNWNRRSEKMVCRACMWFVPKPPLSQLVAVETPPSDRLGRCRRHAPTLGGWPVVFAADWCGDHKLDENRVLVLTQPVKQKDSTINPQQKQKRQLKFCEFCQHCKVMEPREHCILFGKDCYDCRLYGPCDIEGGHYSEIVP